MSPDTLRELFDRASTLDAEAQDRLLAELADAGHPRAADLARLIAGVRSGSSPLDESPLGVFDGTLLDGTSLDDEPPLPKRIGPYPILREIGRGGMGRVYLAEQEGDGFRRRIALKVVAPLFADPELDRRVREEHRILAGLEHPGIARFYDAGRIPDGGWYLALEYVEGSDLTTHVRKHALPVEQRVRLLLEVVDAVAHAHAHGIVHRDLKPGNIMVGEDGRPRLLDFGIAKLVEPGPDAGPTVTLTANRTMTPAYASPEQFRGEPVQMASDVFSLGVVLYELVAGRRPFAPDSRSPAELERAVLGEDPETPSTAARRHSTATTASGTEAPVEADRLRTRGASRDLDAICLKALAKSAAERYPSAVALAEDLRALLEGRPVAARGGGTLYRVARLARRRRAQVTTVAALAIAASAILVAVVAQRRLERSVAPEARAVEPFPPTVEPNVALEDLRRRFAASPESRVAGASLALALASRGEAPEATTVIGRLRQLPGAGEDPLVDFAESVVATHLDQPQRALALVDRALAAPPERARRELTARLRLARSRSLSDLGQTAEAVVELEAAIDAARRAGEAPTLAVALNDLAVEKLMAGDLTGGEALLEESLAAASEAGDRFRVGLVERNLAGLAFVRGQPGLAETRYRSAIAALDEIGRERHAAGARADLAQVLGDLGRPREAAASLEDAIARLRRIDHKTSLAFALALGADAELERGGASQAEALAAEIESGAGTSGNPASLALAQRVRARSAAVRGDLRAARDRFASARRLFVESGNLDQAAETDLLLAETELDAGQPARAGTVLDTLAAGLAGGDATSNSAFAALALRARLAATDGRATEAAALLAELAGAESSPSLSRRLAYLRARAELARAEGRAEDARRDLAESSALARTMARPLLAARLDAELATPDLAPRSH